MLLGKVNNYNASLHAGSRAEYDAKVQTLHERAKGQHLVFVDEV